MTTVQEVIAKEYKLNGSVKKKEEVKASSQSAAWSSGQNMQRCHSRRQTQVCVIITIFLSVYFFVQLRNK